MNHLHRYLKVVPNFKNRDQAKSDFLALSKMIYQESEDMGLIKNFEREYPEFNKEEILKWYTKDSFLYRVTNNCLRIATSDSIQYCRLLLKDLEKAIKQHYQLQSKSFNGLLYRGAYLSEEEWLNLKSNMNREIEMHGFLSVAKEKKVALNFVKSDSSKKILITIIVPKGPNEEEQGFAEVEKFSHFPEEKEILFNVRSRFTVLETENEYTYLGSSKCRHLVLLYGAQGFRRFITEQEAIQEVIIPNIEDVLCAHCQSFEKLLYISIADPNKQIYYCKGCTIYGVGPFLCLHPDMKNAGKESITKIKGCLLMNSSQDKIPFYGYKCCKCQAKRQKSYFSCTDCDGRNNIWCENCFDWTSKCGESRHNIILETNAFSFWYEKMSRAELDHLKFQKNSLVKDSHIFQQARMYIESHESQKAIEYYSLFIKENEGKDDKIGVVAASYNNLGLIHHDRGEYKTALEYLLKYLAIAKSVYGDNHHSVALSYNNIGRIYGDQGESRMALEYYFKSLEFYQSTSGDNLPDIATCLNNIAGEYYRQREYTKALEYYLKAIDILESISGDNYHHHHHIATAYNNIGIIYQDQKDFKKALESSLKSLEMRKAIYGDAHPDVASSYHNIGSLFDCQGDSGKALEYYFKSLEIFQSIYGENHPYLATFYNNIGLSYKSQGKYEKALEYYFKSLKISQSPSGENHLNAADSYYTIAMIYDKKREYEKAKEYCLKCLEIRRLISEEDRLEGALCHNRLGSLYESTGDKKKSLEHYLKSLEIMRAVYGEFHSEVAISYYNTGLAFQKIGDYGMALEHHLNSLEIKKALDGENPAFIGNSFYYIGLAFESLEVYDSALEYYLKSLEIEKFISGENSAKTATAYANVGRMYFHLGNHGKKALECHLKCLEIRKLVFGEIHPEVDTSCEHIGLIYYGQGDFQK